MQFAAQIIFWGSMLALLHSYVFYPLLMRFLARGKRPNAIIFTPDDPDLPVVSVLMSVHNEERVIGPKIYSLTKLNYPPEKLRIYIGSDCSTDRTNDLVAHAFDIHFPLPHAHFSLFPKRRGKPPVINDLAARAQADFEQIFHPALAKATAGNPETLQPSNPKPSNQQPSPRHIFLLTDASVMLEPDTLYNLVRHFKNDRIGVVDANMRSEGLRVQGISRSEERYLSGEVGLKNREGLAWGMMIGPFGGCYAFRADLFEPIPPRSLVDDFWLVFRVLERGYQAINDLDAVCYEGATHRVADEYRRKKRIAAGSFQNLARFRRWVLPPVTRLGFAFFSHKVLRWFGGFFLLAILLSSGFLGLQDQAFRVLFWLLLVGTAGVFVLNYIQNQLLSRPIILLKNIAYFLAMNIALTDGFFKWVRGIRDNTWQRTTRS
ncbi:MAG: glycosyltransferase [Lewinellaceae bacterium]|nr:glycosyltransferase [Lewinellaceae bacterium]